MKTFEGFLKNKKLNFFLDSTLHSYSQILFSENKILGVAILLASFIHPFAGMNGLLGALCTNLCAYKLGHNRIEIKVGIFGFNGVLYGMALCLYSGMTGLQVTLFVILFSILLTVIKTLTSAFFGKYSLPFLSIPFVLLTWMAILTVTRDAHNTSYLFYGQYQEYNLFYLTKIFLKNIGHIVFSHDEISGVLIIAGLLFYSRTMFFIAILSFSVIISFSFFFPQYNYFIVNYGFNSILTSIALGGVFFAPNLKSLSMAIIASIFTVIIGNILLEFFSTYNIPVLTAPFNIVTILFIYAMQKNLNETGFYRIFIPDSPEDNYRRFLRESDRYGKIDRGFILPVMGWWFVSQGIDGKHTHKGIYRWGVDFIVTDKNEKSYKGSGNELDEHYCYNMPAISPGEGVIFAVESSSPDNPVTKTNLDNSWGNYVIIQHNPSLFSILCHLGQQRVAVDASQSIKKGENVGYVGSSGLAPYPHLHIQFQSISPLGSPTIPVYFSDFLIRKEDCYEYVPLGIPEERQTVSNIPINSNIKDAIGFELGQTTNYELKINRKKHLEVWKCDMDSKGVLFVESSLNKDRLYFLKSERSISFCQYIGKKDSGLYMLSLAIDKIPFYADERLWWQKKMTYFEVLTGMKSLLWEFIIPYIKSGYIFASHTFKAVDSRFVLSSSVLKDHKECIAKRSIVFDNGLLELTYKAKDKTIRLKRLHNSF